MLLRWILGVLEGSAPMGQITPKCSPKRYHGGFLRRLWAVGVCNSEQQKLVLLVQRSNFGCMGIAKGGCLETV